MTEKTMGFIPHTMHGFHLRRFYFTVNDNVLLREITERVKSVIEVSLSALF